MYIAVTSDTDSPFQQLNAKWKCVAVLTSINCICNAHAASRLQRGRSLEHLHRQPLGREQGRQQVGVAQELEREGDQAAPHVLQQVGVLVQ